MTQCSSHIRAVLFDADGVVQCVPPGWLDKLRQLNDNHENDEQFLSEIFEAEHPGLVGHGDFGVVLEGVLSRWNSSVKTSDALLLWNLIIPDPHVLNLISKRRKTTVVGLATNQQQHRAKYMLEDLGYSELFDSTIMSCDIGVAKPNIEFFYRALKTIGLPADTILFIDDHDSNVDSARNVGMHARRYHLGSGVQELENLLRTFGL